MKRIGISLFFITTISICVSEKKEYTHKDFKKHFNVRHLKKTELSPELGEMHTITQDDSLYLASPEYYDDLTTRYGRLIDKGYVAPVVVRFVDKKLGHGVFAKKNIKAGEMIGDYTGILCNMDSIKDTLYSFSYPAIRVDGTEIDNFVIDASEAGNITRFVNHSTHNPNVYVETIPYKNIWHQVFIASCDINEGEQLFIDYGSGYWESLGITPE